MHFQLPKPLHGWREFTGEVGIIVIGVLIALGAEQVVEHWSWGNRVRDAEASMTKELGQDDGPQASARILLSSCIDHQLERAQTALLDERDRGAVFVPPPLSTPPFRTWDSQAWQAAVSSGVTNHMGTERMYAWGAPYNIIGGMDQAALRENQDWSELEAMTTLRPHPSEVERERILAAIARARHDNRFLTWIAGVFLKYSSKAGVTIPEASKQDELQSELKVMKC